ncbi:MAG: hypothetical protein AB7S26_06100 [Sandaracinaceae bacterium]
MTARDKIQGLTIAWYLYTLAGGAGSILMNGIGPISLMVTVLVTTFWLAVTFLIGRSLERRNGLTRAVMIGMSGLGAIIAPFMAWQVLAALYHQASFNVVLAGLGVAVNFVMAMYSLRCCSIARCGATSPERAPSAREAWPG